jgi:hypothetical protein
MDDRRHVITMNPRWNTKAATTVLLGSLLLGSGAPVMSAASSSTAPTPSVTVQALSQAPSTSSTAASHSTTPAQPAAPVSTAQETGEKRGWLRPVIDWLKRNVPAAWNALTSWGARSWNNFVAWWNGLASWIRWTVDTLWTGTIWELYVALRDFIF